MQFKVAELAVLLNGAVEGNDDKYLNQVARLSEADGSSLSFLANHKYEGQLYRSKAGAVLVSKDFKPKQKTPVLIRVDDPYSAFAVVLEQFERSAIIAKIGIEDPVHVDKAAVIGEETYLGAFSYVSRGCTIGKGTKIYPQVFIGDNVTIGENCILFPGVKIYANSVIGDYCTLHAGAIIGSEGFGFAHQKDGTFKRVPQLGNVVLGNHVSIGANTTIDRATVHETIIGSGVKLDNLVHIGHNVSVGKDSAIAAQTGIAGSTTIGENCMFGGQVGIVGHLDIPNRTQIAPKGGIMSDFKEEGRVLLGAPAMDFRHTKKVWVVWKKLPELQKKIEQLEALLKKE